MYCSSDFRLMSIPKWGGWFCWQEKENSNNGMRNEFESQRVFWYTDQRLVEVVNMKNLYKQINDHQSYSEILEDLNSATYDELCLLYVHNGKI